MAGQLLPPVHTVNKRTPLRPRFVIAILSINARLPLKTRQEDMHIVIRQARELVFQLEFIASLFG